MAARIRTRSGSGDVDRGYDEGVYDEAADQPVNGLGTV